MTPRERRLLAVFNLTQEMWDKIFKEQDGRCGICHKVFDPDEIILTDHDHKTGQVRGLLCFKCNAILGEGVTIELFTRVIAYLKYLPATKALGGPHFGLPGRVGTSMKRKRALARKRDKETQRALEQITKATSSTPVRDDPGWTVPEPPGSTLKPSDT